MWSIWAALLVFKWNSDPGGWGGGVEGSFDRSEALSGPPQAYPKMIFPDY